MKATLVVSTLLGLSAAHVMPRAMAGGYTGDKTTSATAVSVPATTKAPLSTGVSYPHGGGDYEDDDDEEYCDDEGDDDDEDDCSEDGCDDDEDDEDDEDDCGKDGCDHDGDHHGDHGDDHSSPTKSHIPVPEITSTVTATSVYTVTSCPPTVTNCPVGHVTTEVVTAYTTYCPKPTADITQYSTIMVTVTDCPKTVTNCPAHTTASVSTCIYTPVPTAQTVYTTVTLPTCPGAPGSCYETHSEVKTSWYYAPGTTAVSPEKTTSVSPVKTAPGPSYPAGTGSPVKPTTVATSYAYGGTGSGAPVPTRTVGPSPTYPVTAGVGKVGFSAAAIVAAVAAFVM